MNIKLSVFAFGFLLLFVLALGFIIGRYTNFLSFPGSQQDTTIVPIPIPEADADPDFEAKPDTVWKTKWKYLHTNIDSLQDEAMEYWKTIYGDSLEKIKQLTFVAKVDTSYNDSLLTFSASYVSPIPLHPASFFRFSNLSVKQKEITKTETKELYWNDSFNIGFGVETEWTDWKFQSGYYGTIRYKIINERFFEMPIGVEINNNLDGRIKLETTLKF